MASNYQSLKIIEAIDNIVSRRYLLPAIQRKFVWSSEQIEMLFDSILRGYPVNTFMFWEIHDDAVKNKFKFYEFLNYYREFYHEDNQEIDTKGLNDFFAVIDGQQRLTAIYLGLKGSYAYRMPRKWLQDTEAALPTRWLYVDLLKPMAKDNERKMKYDFRFLTAEEHAKLSEKTDSYWFKLNDILNHRTFPALQMFIAKQPWNLNEFAVETISVLWNKVFNEDILNYYLEKSQDIDTVLDIFIRTNSGGEPLSFSNLLMSITTANWEKDARNLITSTVKRINDIGNPGFRVSEDFILKTCLVLFNDNIKFQIKNFDSNSVKTFEENWSRIEASIIAAFNLLATWGFNDSSLRAKNAVIPIIYYIYHNELEKDIDSKTKYLEEKAKIRQWLCISLLKGVFGSHSDGVLTGVRKVLETHKGDKKFPLDEIKVAFQFNPSKNLSVDDDFIDGLLTVQKDAPECYPILALLYSHLNFENQPFHKDHLHPASYFRKLKPKDFGGQEVPEFYKNKDNWNSILNLQLLNSALNESKNDAKLKDWVADKQVDLDNQLIPKDVSLDERDFEAFISRRREYLRKGLKNIMEGRPFYSDDSASQQG